MGTCVLYWVERQWADGTWVRVGMPTSLDGARTFRTFLTKQEPATRFRVAEVTTVTVIVE